MLIFYFTSSGNSLYIAKRIGGKLMSIPQVLKNNDKFFKDESIGIIFPCYGFGVPNIVKRFIENVELKADYFFTIMTYGNIAANGLKLMEDLANKRGIIFNYTNEILMIDNYLPSYKMEDQLKKEPLKKIEENICIITDDISKRINKKIKKGIGAKLASFIIQNTSPFRKGNIDNQFIIGENCTRCGVCVKVCPKSNIKMEDKPTYNHNCDFCMGCINLCPQNSISLKSQRSSARFKNQHIKVSEIIEANNQF